MPNQASSSSHNLRNKLKTWVRSVCNSSSISEWSDSTRFFIADLNAGTYMVRIITENGTTYKKLIVK